MGRVKHLPVRKSITCKSSVIASLDKPLRSCLLRPVFIDWSGSLFTSLLAAPVGSPRQWGPKANAQAEVGFRSISVRHCAAYDQNACAINAPVLAPERVAQGSARLAERLIFFPDARFVAGDPLPVG